MEPTSVLTPDLVDIHYVNVPAKIFIEVDIRADVEDLGETGYITLKTNELFKFGRRRSSGFCQGLKSHRRAKNGENQGTWVGIEDTEVLDGVTFNIGKYLAQKGINPLGKG
ncbi:MAG: hypothetical protein IPM82_08460 [Saprospiraceae bacterium]|nr:hypothetical protein [Saprospiraceae bacterium]